VHFRLGFLALLAVVLPLLGAGCSRTPEADPFPEIGPVADFSLVNQDGKKVTREELRGKVWVAGFIFTRCAGPCPQVTANMAKLQADLAGHEDVALVSFTVDPDHDTPAVLKRYARTYGADPDRWSFLTGKKEPLYRLIQKSFLQGVEENRGAARTSGNRVTHSTQLVVVDRRGHVRGYYDRGHVRASYDGKDPEELKNLLKNVLALAGEAP
jgi:cytochrome oxidase Cu insertion factor (SCO1/SenC/PrrC family)